MDINRRSLLFGLGVASICSMVPSTVVAAIIDPVPIIVGDGVHDDTAGLQALIDGRTFRVAPGLNITETNDTVMVREGYFRLSKGLKANGTNDKNIHFSNFRIDADIPDDEYAIDLTASKNMIFEKGYIKINSGGGGLRGVRFLS